MNFIQELLSVSNEEIIDKLETLLKREGQHPTAFDLLVVLNKEEVEEMERTIVSS